MRGAAWRRSNLDAGSRNRGDVIWKAYDDLQVTEPKHRGKHGSVAIGPPHDRRDARDELLWRKRYDKNVVHAALERHQLGFEVAPSRQRYDGKAAISVLSKGVVALHPSRRDHVLGAIRALDDLLHLGSC
jgi:hypothetical protein